MADITLYHAGFDIIPRPDIHFGRKNADFGQGFYLSRDKDFCKRWAREKRGFETILNKYSLSLDGLKIKRLERGSEWFDYIFANRRSQPDTLAEYDVIIGAIANDTLFDTMGMTTSGVLSREISSALLMLGAEYEQTVIKTELAASRLSFLGAERLDSSELARCKAALRAKEEAFIELFASKLERLTEAADT